MKSSIILRLIGSVVFATPWPSFSSAQAPLASPQTQSGSDSGPRTDQLVEITVTAERRNENLQSVPIAVTALTAADLQQLGVSATTDLALAAPALTFNSGIGGASITIRGVGGTGNGADELASGIYLDGAYLTSPSAAIFQLANIDRIEVLEGPQGTLFGRNSSSGAIQIITHRPDDQTLANVSVGHGNYDTTTVTGYVSGKLVDTLYADVSAFYEDQHEGWGRNIFDGTEAYYGGATSVRTKLRWVPGDDTDITLALMHNETQNPSPQGNAIIPGEYTTGPLKTTNVGFFDTNTNVDQFIRSIEQNVSLNAKQDFHYLRFLSITTFDYTNLNASYDNDAGPSPVVNFVIESAPQRSYTQELQLQSEPESWAQWVVGTFFFNTQVGFTPGIGNKVVVLNARAGTDSYAGFGQVTIPITSSTHFTAGLRYTADLRDFRASESVFGNLTVFPRSDISNKETTWRLALDHEFTPSILGYVSYDRGAKSGLYNLAQPLAPPVNPQLVDAYELGLKTELFDRHLRLNGDIFYNKFSDIQVQSLTNNVPSYLNAAGAHIQGAELNLTAKPLEHITLQGGYAYLDGYYTSFSKAPFFSVNPPAMGGLTEFFANAAGEGTVNTPRNVLTASVAYELETTRGDYSLSVTNYYNSGYWFDPQNRVRQPSYSTLGAVGNWRSGDSGLYAQLWGKNLNNAHYYAFSFTGTSGDTYSPAAPRTYGITVGYRFQGPK